MHYIELAIISFEFLVHLTLQESELASGVAYAELDFAGRDLPIKPPTAFEKVQYADVH